MGINTSKYKGGDKVTLAKADSILTTVLEAGSFDRNSLYISGSTNKLDGFIADGWNVIAHESAPSLPTKPGIYKTLNSGGIYPYYVLDHEEQWFAYLGPRPDQRTEQKMLAGTGNEPLVELVIKVGD